MTKKVKKVRDLKDLLCGFDENDVFTTTKTGQLMLNGKLMVTEEMRALKEEVKFLKNTRIWSVFTNTLKEQAYRTMFEKSKDFNDMITGKMMLYNIDVMKRILMLIDNYQFPKPVKTLKEQVRNITEN